MSAGKKNRLAGVLKLIALPLVVWAIFQYLTVNLASTSVINNVADLKALFRTLLSAYCFALALNCNMPSGRMDLSLGAQMYMGCIFGGNLALMMGLGGLGVLIFSIIAGGICGLLVGILFVNLRILPMILGLGMTFIFECFSFAAYRQQGLILYGKQGVDILSNIGFMLIVAVIILLLISYLFQFSVYGYKRRAIQGSQKLAADSGINVFTNCIQCYILAGGLVAIAGIFDTAYKGTLIPVMGMSSNGSVFSNMFPLFLGVVLGNSVGNPILGILMGSLSVKLMMQGLSKLALENSVQNIIIYSLFLIFNVYRMNAHKIEYLKQKRERIRVAREKRNNISAQRSLSE